MEAAPWRETLDAAQRVVNAGAVTFRSEDEWQSHFQAVLDANRVGTALLSDPQRDPYPGFENLPESMLGSYEVRYYADDPAPDGSVTVTYVVTNETSVDSGTRIPLTGGKHVPIVYDVLTELDDTSGNFRTQQQMIVWSERIYP